MISPAIFRSYDIRGKALVEITPEIAYKIGFCFASHLLENLPAASSSRKICVGRDGRLSSLDLFNGLVKGLIAAGTEVITIGMVPTPVLYFADKKLMPMGSIMITGSHNPKEDNGFKMLAQGCSFFGSQISQLYRKIIATNWDEETIAAICHADSFNSVTEINVTGEYIDRILEDCKISSHLKVAWDPGNGAAGEITTMLATNHPKLPNHNLVINAEIDGNFPNHHPDPTILANLEQLIDLVRRHNCDLGIAFDGDGDRIGVVTNKGRMIFGDQLLCFFAEDILANNPSATIIADVKASGVVFDQIAKFGGIPVMWRTGHSHIKSKMQETGALLAGEMSGHMFFADKYYGYDDAIYAALRLLDLLSGNGKTLDEMLEELPQLYNTPEIHIPVADEQKFQIIEEIKKGISKRIAEKLPEGPIEFNDIDGLRVTTSLGWWLVRASNTQPAIIARCESSSAEGLELLKQELAVILAEYGLAVKALARL